MKRIISFLLIMLMVLPMLFSCVNNEEKNGDSTTTVGDTTTADTTAADTTDPSETTTPENTTTAEQTTTKPTTTKPQTTKPQSTRPTTTKPQTTPETTPKPITTKPQSTRPTETSPSETHEPVDTPVPDASGAYLSVVIDKEAPKWSASNRPYDSAKEDITLILVIGQSNSTTKVGFGEEYSAYTYAGTNPRFPEAPIRPSQEGIAYSIPLNSGVYQLGKHNDMYYVSNSTNNENTVGGFTPAFATKWNELTDTKVVFVQAAVGGTALHLWVPDPENYDCVCNDCSKGTPYLANALSNYTLVYNILAKQYNVVYTGYLWNQGEADELDATGATIYDDKTYYDAFKSMHDHVINTLGLDFGGISVVRSDANGDTAQASSAYTRARYAQYKLCNDIENLYMISTLGETCDKNMMNLGGDIHYAQSTFNIMGTEMATNLYSALGLGTLNKYDGIRIYGKNGATLCKTDANGNVVSGTDELSEANTEGRALVRLNTLGREDYISFDLYVDGVNRSAYVDEFGKINWAGLKADLGIEKIKVVVTVQ